ncbi:WD40 repeat domain-containing protein, partial [Singulisphaera rosea]
EVKLWDVATGKALPPPAEPYSGTQAIAFSPDGQALAAGGVSSGIRVWDLVTRKPRSYSVVMGEERTTIHNPYGRVRALAFTPDGLKLISGHDNHSTVVWDAMTGFVLNPLGIHREAVTALAISGDGRKLVTGSFDRRIVLWDAPRTSVERWQPKVAFTGFRRPIRSVALSPDARTIAATAFRARPIYLWDPGRVEPRFRLAIPSGVPRLGFEGLAFSPNGKVLVVGGDRTLLTWDVTSGSRHLQAQPAARHDETATLIGHEDSIRELFLSDDGRTLACLGNSGAVRVWDVPKRIEQKKGSRSASFVQIITLSRDGSKLAIGTSGFGVEDNKRTVHSGVQIWETRTGKHFEAPKVHSDVMKAVEFTPDGSTLITASRDGDIRFWDSTALTPKPEILKNEQGVESLRISPDGKLMAVAAHMGSIALWDIASRSRLSTFTHPGHIRDVRFSPDGRTLAVGGGARHDEPGGSARMPGALTLWDVPEGRPRFPPLGQKGWINSLAFSPDGQVLGASSEGNQVILWDVTSGEAKTILRGHTDAVQAIAFSPDGKLVASGGRDLSLKLWNSRSGELRATLQGHEADIADLKFLPDSSTIVTAGYDATIKLWNVRDIPTSEAQKK